VGDKKSKRDQMWGAKIAQLKLEGAKIAQLRAIKPFFKMDFD
jgi:hypothetical protein